MMELCFALRSGVNERPISAGIRYGYENVQMQKSVENASNKCVAAHKREDTQKERIISVQKVMHRERVAPFL
jgi:alkylhydroperoxidase family enzyme